jgi:hypothetical protein
MKNIFNQSHPNNVDPNYTGNFDIDPQNLVIGQEYIIQSVGDTDWIACGATHGIRNEVFTATGQGSGSGKAIEYIGYHKRILPLITTNANHELDPIAFPQYRPHDTILGPDQDYKKFAKDIVPPFHAYFSDTIGGNEGNFNRFDVWNKPSIIGYPSAVEIEPVQYQDDMTDIFYAKGESPNARGAGIIFPSAHPFNDGDPIVLSGFDGDFAQLNGVTLYARNDNPDVTISLWYDKQLTQQVFIRPSQDISFLYNSGDFATVDLDELGRFGEITFKNSGGHILANGDTVQFSTRSYSNPENLYWNYTNGIYTGGDAMPFVVGNYSPKFTVTDVPDVYSPETAKFIIEGSFDPITPEAYSISIENLRAKHSIEPDLIEGDRNLFKLHIDLSDTPARFIDMSTGVWFTSRQGYLDKSSRVNDTYQTDQFGDPSGVKYYLKELPNESDIYEVYSDKELTTPVYWNDSILMSEVKSGEFFRFNYPAGTDVLVGATVTPLSTGEFALDGITYIDDYILTVPQQYNEVIQESLDGSKSNPVMAKWSSDYNRYIITEPNGQTFYGSSNFISMPQVTLSQKATSTILSETAPNIPVYSDSGNLSLNDTDEVLIVINSPTDYDSTTFNIMGEYFLDDITLSQVFDSLQHIIDNNGSSSGVASDFTEFRLENTGETYEGNTIYRITWTKDAYDMSVTSPTVGTSIGHALISYFGANYGDTSGTIYTYNCPLLPMFSSIPTSWTINGDIVSLVFEIPYGYTLPFNSNDKIFWTRPRLVRIDGEKFIAVRNSSQYFNLYEYDAYMFENRLVEPTYLLDEYPSGVTVKTSWQEVKNLAEYEIQNNPDIDWSDLGDHIMPYFGPVLMDTSTNPPTEVEIDPTVDNGAMSFLCIPKYDQYSIKNMLSRTVSYRDVPGYVDDGYGDDYTYGGMWDNMYFLERDTNLYEGDQQLRATAVAYSNYTPTPSVLNKYYGKIPAFTPISTQLPNPGRGGHLGEWMYKERYAMIMPIVDRRPVRGGPIQHAPKYTIGYDAQDDFRFNQVRPLTLDGSEMGLPEDERVNVEFQMYRIVQYYEDFGAESSYFDFESLYGESDDFWQSTLTDDLNIYGSVPGDYNESDKYGLSNSRNPLLRESSSGVLQIPDPFDFDVYVMAKASSTQFQSKPYLEIINNDNRNLEIGRMTILKNNNDEWFVRELIEPGRYLSNSNPPPNPPTMDQGTVSTNFESTTAYHLTSLDLIHFGNKQWDPETTYMSARIYKPWTENRLGYSTLTESGIDGHGPESAPEITMDFDSNNRIRHFYFNGPHEVDYGSDDPVMLVIIGDPAAPSEQELTPLEQEELLELTSGWDNNSDRDHKLWPTSVLPSSVSVGVNHFNTTAVSKGGKKFVKDGGIQKWSINLKYPPMTTQEFAPFLAAANSANGAAYSFKLPLRVGDFTMFKFHDGGTVDTGLLYTEVLPGTSEILLDGLTNNDVINNGEMVVIGESNNGHINTVVATSDTNVFGETRVKLSYPIQETQLAGTFVEFNPEYAIVSLSENSFQFSEDINGLYYLEVDFDFDGWRE